MRGRRDEGGGVRGSGRVLAIRNDVARLGGGWLAPVLKGDGDGGRRGGERRRIGDEGCAEWMGC
jgi:hypothetical protein